MIQPTDAARHSDLSDADTISAHPAIRVLLVDDHEIIRKGLAGLLRTQPDLLVVGEAADGAAAMDQIRQLRPDVVILDVNMPGPNGLAVTHHINVEMPQVRIIGLSFHEEPGMAAAMRDAGAAAYLTKGGPSQELIHTIREVTGRAAAPAE
jgi:DNA-binding NarL/FixJ family response regulator